MLQGAGYRATGVDGQVRYIKKAQENYFEIDFINARAEKLPFSDNSFDAVVSYNTAEHFNQIEESFLEMIRVVRPGGRILIDSPNLLSPRIALNAIINGNSITFDGKKNIFELMLMFFSSIVLIAEKNLVKKASFIRRKPDLSLSISDADATWYLNSVDLKYYFLNNGCKIWSYQAIDHVYKNKSRLEIILANLFPSFMGITRVVFVKKS